MFKLAIVLRHNSPKNSIEANLHNLKFNQWLVEIYLTYSIILNSAVQHKWRGRWEGGSGWGRHVNSRTFHFNVWQNSLQIKKINKYTLNDHQNILLISITHKVMHFFPVMWIFKNFYSVQFSSVLISHVRLCDPMNRSRPGFPVHHQLSI